MTKLWPGRTVVVVVAITVGVGVVDVETVGDAVAVVVSVLSDIL